MISYIIQKEELQTKGSCVSYLNKGVFSLNDGHFVFGVSAAEFTPVADWFLTAITIHRHPLGWMLSAGNRLYSNSNEQKYELHCVQIVRRS